MRHYSFLVTIAVIFAQTLLLPVSASAQFECSEKKMEQSAVKAVVSKLEKRYQHLVDLQANFEQESLFLGFSERIKSKGTVVFKKPGMMDWNYDSPERQRFVADGSDLWFYQPEMNQVTVGRFQQSFQSGLPVSFLLGLGSLTQDFTVESGCKSADGVVLQLSPKIEDPSLQEFKLLVDAKNGLPQGAHVVDVGGNETQIVFSQIETDGKIAKSQFEFTIPKGVDVIDQRQQGSYGSGT